ncbi:hypothetical protein F4810DRAFT_713300 [Camillea tinctor]|nr:hypothetical protein F4810DRAFT_713300 [Camillea tinctor]
MVSPIQRLSRRDLQLCCEFLLPDPLPTVGPKYRDHENLVRQHTLANICKLGRIFKKAAQPVLYRNIVVHNGRELMALFRTLMNYEELRHMVITLAIPFDFGFQTGRIKSKPVAIWFKKSLGLTEWSVIRKIDRVRFRPPSDHSVPITPDRLSSGPFDMSRINLEMWVIQGDRDDIYEGMVAGIIRLVNQLDDLFLEAPLTNLSLGYSWTLCQTFMDSYLCDHGPLKKLRSLRLYGSTRALAYPNGYVAFGGIYPTCTVPYRVGQTQSLEFYGDDGDWQVMVDTDTEERDPNPRYKRDGVSYLLRLTELKLYQSRTSPHTLRRLLGCCDSLKSLAYTTRSEEWNRVDETEDTTLISDALISIKAQLETLHFEIVTRLVDDTIGEETAEETEIAWEHIACLPEFPALKHLTIDAASLLGPTHEVRASLPARDHPLHEFLPPNLETLTITARPCQSDLALYETDADSRLQHRDHIVSHLALLLQDLDRGGLPELWRIDWTLHPVLRDGGSDEENDSGEEDLDFLLPFNTLEAWFRDEHDVEFQIHWAVLVECQGNVHECEALLADEREVAAKQQRLASNSNEQLVRDITASVVGELRGLFIDQTTQLRQEFEASQSRVDSLLHRVRELESRSKIAETSLPIESQPMSAQAPPSEPTSS